MPFDKELLAKNIERWMLFYPREAIILSHLKEKKVQFYTNSDQSLNLKIEDMDCCYHAMQDPREEAKQWFESSNIKEKNALIVFGVGLGYAYEAAKNWLHSNPLYQIIFLEPDLEVIYHLFQTELGTELLKDSQVSVAPVDLNGQADIALSIFCNNTYLFVSLPIYEKNIPAFIEICKSNVAFRLKLKMDSILEFVDYGYAFCSNYYRNLFMLPQAYLGNSLLGKFKNIPAIICGAGPSLEKSFDFLQASKNKALIFGGGTAMNGLNVAGLLPHFGVGIDPNISQYTRLIMNQAFEVPYFYRSRMSHTAVEFIHGLHLYLTGSTGYDIGPYFENKLGLEGHTVEEGYNVINFSLSIALALGCNPIIFVGVDLAYTDGLSYNRGILNHPLHERRDYFGTKTAKDELVQKTDIFGKPVLTLWKWIAESLWFSTVAKNNPSVNLYNATQGGIGFQGIPNVSHDFITQHILNRSYDFEGRVHAAIMQASMPPQLNKSMLIECLKELLQSLQKSQKLVESLYKSLTETVYREELKSSIESPELSEHVLATRRHLEEEVAYKAILKNFGNEYVSIYQHEYRKLLIDESLVQKKEFRIKTAKLEIGKLVFQMETLRTHIDLIETVLAEDTDREVSARLSTSKVLPPTVKLAIAKDVYSYENNYLEMIDPVINLHHQERFIPDPDRGVERTFFEQGPIQHIEYSKEGKIHGPSIYYSLEGKVLAQHWYLDGYLEGKGEGYYPNGSLAHITRHRTNRLEGKQYYFYPSGSLKSLLNYSQGLLHGEIKLYYPSGQLFRHLFFENGKRQGFDRIWNKAGTLIIEAEFNRDLPVGVTKQWHPSGALAKEVFFTPDSPLYEVHHWDELGAPIANVNVQHDFFDHVAEQSQILTATLQEAVNRVEKVVPILGQKQTSGDMQNLVEQLMSLQEQLKMLDNISHQMLFESGLDPSNPQEAIWKTPNLRQEMEQEISKMDEKMKQEIQSIKNSLDKNIKITNPPIQGANKHE